MTHATHEPLTSGLHLLDHSPGTSGELELDWGAVPWLTEVPAALPKRRARRSSRRRRRRRTGAVARSGLWSTLRKDTARPARGLCLAGALRGLTDLPKRFSSRLAPAWAGALAAAGIQLCPACCSRNLHRATFCHECHVTLREVRLSRRPHASPARRRPLEVHSRVAQALVASLVLTVLLVALVL